MGPSRTATPPGDAKRKDEAVAALAKAPFFSSLDARALGELARASRRVTLRTRQSLWTQGSRATHVGLVLSGRLKVTRSHLRREVILDVAGPGDVLGEVALSLGGTQAFDVRCLRRAVVLLVPVHSVQALIAARPALCRSLSLDLARQVLRLTRRVEALSSGGVEQRLARVVVNLAKRHGQPFPGGTLVPVRLRREDLAAMAATTLESASRRIAAWRRSGLVVQQPGALLVPDLSALEALAEG